MNVQDEAPRMDEIDLYPCWLRIKKYAGRLIALALVAAIAAGLVSSYYLPKIYRVNAAVSLGRIEAGGRIVGVARLADLQQLVGMGSFNKNVLSNLNLNGASSKLNLGSRIVMESTEGSESVVLSYDTANPDQAVQILREVIKEIQRTYNQRVEVFRQLKEADMTKIREAISLLEYKRERLKLETDNLTQEIRKRRELADVEIAARKHEQAKISDQIRCLADRKAKALAIRGKLDNLSLAMEDNTQALLKSKADLARDANTGEVLASILFANNVQQNIGLLGLDYERIRNCDLAASQAQEQIDNLTGQMKQIKEDIKTITITADADIRSMGFALEQLKLRHDKEIPAEIRKVGGDLERLRAERDMTTGIEVVAAPDFLNRPVRPDPKHYAAGAGALSLLIGVLGVCLTKRPDEDPGPRAGQDNR